MFVDFIYGCPMICPIDLQKLTYVTGSQEGSPNNGRHTTVPIADKLCKRPSKTYLCHYDIVSKKNHGFKLRIRQSHEAINGYFTPYCK